MIKKRMALGQAPAAMLAPSHKRNPVPLGPTLDRIMGDYWAIVNRVSGAAPSAVVLLPSEVRERAPRGEKDGRISYWLQFLDYEHDSFREKWERIGQGGL